MNNIIMSGKTCFDCKSAIVENSKFCSGCGIAQPVVPETPTPTPAPVVPEVIEKTVEQEFDEFLADFRKKIYLSHKMTTLPMKTAVLRVMDKYNLKELPEKFKQFGPLMMNTTFTGDAVMICKYPDVVSKEYHGVFPPQATFEAYKKDDSIIGNYICISPSLTYLNNKYDNLFKRKFFEMVDKLVKSGDYTKEYIIRHFETMQFQFGEINS